MSAGPATEGQNDAFHLQVKTQSEIALAKIKAELDARMAVLDAHLKDDEAQRTPRSTCQARERRETATIMFQTRSGPANICWSFTMPDFSPGAGRPSTGFFRRLAHSGRP